ncbi:hypothetical protein, partial [Leyella stercorea]|uniref:hypothetical protein n=1 Tax=Leyella stercorea TaxID=363265 RepID=UPI003FF0DDE3
QSRGLGDVYKRPRLYFHVTHRSTQMSASVDADVRNGRRRCPQRSTRMSATVGADVRIGRRR